jgi:hypothetical protein
VPLIDCVLFADPKQSTVDIVQAVGRALRTYNGKEFGYVIVPVVTRGESEADLIESEAFGAVLRVLRALAANDERIIEYFRAVAEGRQGKGGIIDIAVDVKIAQTIDLATFIKRVEMKVWKRLARLSFKPYDEAVKFVHTLGLKSQNEWMAYSKTRPHYLPARPYDIPASPNNHYGREFTHKGGWGAWLGTGRRASHRENNSGRKWRSYNEAVKFVKSLGLQRSIDWRLYCKGEFFRLPTIPHDILKSPEKVYKDEYVNETLSRREIENCCATAGNSRAAVGGRGA